jgi:hypothetical protein
MMRFFMEFLRYLASDEPLIAENKYSDDDIYQRDFR